VLEKHKPLDKTKRGSAHVPSSHERKKNSHAKLLTSDQKISREEAGDRQSQKLMDCLQVERGESWH